MFVCGEVLCCGKLSCSSCALRQLSVERNAADEMSVSSISTFREQHPLGLKEVHLFMEKRYKSKLV